MLIVYSTPNCPRCAQLKARLAAEGKQPGQDYVEMIVGRDVDRETFQRQHPAARSFPYTVELPATAQPRAQKGEL